MGLTAQQLTYLKTADQRFRAHVGLFAKYTPTVTAPAPGAGTLLAPKPIPRISPRYALVNHSASIVLLGTNSINRGGAYVGNANISFALQAGSGGSITDHGNGTATYTAPANGAGTAQINVTVSNSNGSRVGFAFVQYPKTTYDEVIAEIASINANIGQHGWKALIRARGNLSGFAIGKLMVVHVEDTWAGTTSTFGGYQYSEGVITGYISAMEYFEDASGQQWLGIEVSPTWYVLERTSVGETHWGQSPSAGNFYIADFKPSDALWHFMNVITDFSQYHDVVLWHDPNYIIDDFIIDESDLATIVDDVAGRTLNVAYSDRYGTLFAVPDLDVHAGWWGETTPIFDSAGAGALTRDYCSEYRVQYFDYQVKKLTLAAFDKSKKGIYAISENLTAPGAKKEIRGLICDQAERLAEWAVQKRAQMNRPWDIEVSRWLDHTVDLVNLVDVNFTSPTLSNGLTASGQTWVESITYRPDIFQGGWDGRWRLVKRTHGDGEAETGGVSSWGGTGRYSTGNPRYSGSGYFGSGSGGWTASGGSGETWCYLFDFVAGTQGWVPRTNLETQGNSIFSAFGGNRARWAAGWQSVSATAAGGNSGDVLEIFRSFSQSVLTGVKLWGSAQATMAFATYLHFGSSVEIIGGTIGNVFVKTWEGSRTATAARFATVEDWTDPFRRSAVFISAMFAGLGINPFGEDNCG